MAKIIDSENLGPSGNGKGREFLLGHEKIDKIIWGLLVLGIIVWAIRQCSV